ncbi:hypothetical protein Q5P01_025012 [Channa striata]|uniref:Uncharacterized protein n=1 Tax=Channa striata TaxID=64152 RepID=A0AA88INV9_CHASR|nr:hypothetical protein Q5P01_025012 [Channa striata]
MKEIISDSGITEKDDKKNIVDVYVSAESLRVYDNPWVEATPPNVLQVVEAQDPVSQFFETPQRRNYVRTDLVCLAVVLLVLCVVIIYLGVQVNKEQDQLSTFKAELTKVANKTYPCHKRELCKKFCGK